MATPGGPAFKAMMRGQGWDFKRFRQGLQRAGMYDDGYVDNHDSGPALKGEFMRRRLDRRAYNMSYPSTFGRTMHSKTRGRSSEWRSGNRGFVPVNRVIREYAPQYRDQMPPVRRGTGRSSGLYRGYAPTGFQRAPRGRRPAVVRDRDAGFNSPPGGQRRRAYLQRPNII